jgi:hypothetical protein
VEKVKKSVYLDTTILSYLADERESIKNFIDVTKEWWKTQKRYYDIYLSVETLAELREGNYPRKEKITPLELF